MERFASGGSSLLLLPMLENKQQGCSVGFTESGWCIGSLFARKSPGMLIVSNGSARYATDLVRYVLRDGERRLFIGSQWLFTC